MIFAAGRDCRQACAKSLLSAMGLRTARFGLCAPLFENIHRNRSFTSQRHIAVGAKKPPEQAAFFI
jgi:hypothetical protein